jgi:serine/threonine-protein kinase
MILGTAAYMAPEQARGASVDKRADIWAFGVVLYEMLTGEQPFAGATVSDTLAAVLKTEPNLARVPAQTQKLLRRCLEKDPKKRLRDIGDAMLTIGEVPQPTVTRHSTVAWAALAGLLAVALAVVAWFAWHRPTAVSQPLTRLSMELPDFALTSQFAPGPGIALSPDGRRIVYTGRDAEGVFRLYTRMLDQDQVKPLAGTEGAYGPFFSPDGQAIGFFAGGKLKKIPVEGGVPVALCDAILPLGASWGQDGSIITALNSSSGLSRISSSGGSAQQLTELNHQRKEFGHAWP